MVQEVQGRPEDDEHSAEALRAPLQGLRVLDICTYVAGPSGAMTLAQLGAEVIRIDPLGGAPDTLRLPRAPDGTSLYWTGLNKAKRSVEMDLSSSEGRELLGRLVGARGRGGGIVLTNAVGQPWLSYETLRAYRQDLIHVQIEGRSGGLPAVDYTVNSEVGLPLLTGPQDFAGPVNHVLPAWDLLTGLHAAVAILAAERMRLLTGRGQQVRIALADVAVATMAHLGYLAEVVVTGRGRPRDGNFVYGTFGCDFSTADGRRVMVVALTEQQWRRLVEVTGVEEAVSALEGALGVSMAEEDSRYRWREALAGLMAPWFRSQTFEETCRRLDEAKVLWGAYRTLEELVADPASLLNRSRIMQRVEQPGVGVVPIPGPVAVFGAPEEARSSGGRAAVEPRVAPRLGQDTEEVLRRLAGLGEEELAELRRRSVIAAGPGRRPGAEGGRSYG